MSCSRSTRPSVLHTQVDNLRDDVRRILREEKVAITGGIGVQARGVQLRIADAGRPRQSRCRNSAQLAQQLRRRAGSAGAPPLDVARATDGLIQRRRSPTPASPTRCAAPSTSRSRCIRRRVDALGTQRAEHPAPGRRPHSSCRCPACRTPQQLKDILGTDREARVPPRRRARRRARPRSRSSSRSSSRARSGSRSRSWCRARI